MNKISPEYAVFPLITINPETKQWKCLGTGFFIQDLGGFITARHVFIDSQGNFEKTLYGVQTTLNDEHHLRPIKFILNHEYADISIGFLGKRRHSNGENSTPERTPFFQVSETPLSINDKVKTYAYPESKEYFNADDNSYELEFNGIWTDGKIIDIHNEGFSLLKGKCYQTNMEIKGGASGGPVLKNGLIVGINSTGYDFGTTTDEPISFITPIDFLYEMSVPANGKNITVEELIRQG